MLGISTELGLEFAESIKSDPVKTIERWQGRIMSFEFADEDSDDVEDDKLCAVATHWPCQAKGAISPPGKEFHVSPYDSYANRMVRLVMRITTWANQYTAHKASWLHALLAVFFIPGLHSLCFVAKKSITQSGFSCPLIWLQSTQRSSKYPLVLFPLSHDLLPAHDHSSCDC